MRWTRKSVRQRSLGKSRLLFERLEDRSLLAVAAFDIHLFHDDGGNPGLPLTDDTVEVGQTFFAQIVAREHHPGFSGLASVFIDIAWDADVLDVVEPFDPKQAVTPNLPLFVGGSLQQEGPTGSAFLLEDGIRQNVGHIAGLGGLASVSSGVGKPIGSDGDDRHVRPAFLGLSTTDDHFAWLHFRAEQAGQALLTMKQNALRIAPLPVASLTSKHLSFERQTVTVVEPAAPDQDPLMEEAPVDVPVQVESVVERAPEPQIETPPPTSVIVETSPIEEPDPVSDEPLPSSSPVWHNAGYPLDVDGTGRVGPVDVLIIANYLNVNFGNWQLPPVQFSPPRYYDVNGDGRCTPHDALLVINYIELQRNPVAEGEVEPFQTSELSETVPVLERPEHVDAALRDAVFTSGISRSRRDRATWTRGASRALGETQNLSHQKPWQVVHPRPISFCESVECFSPRGPRSRISCRY
jgi:hypothetical protein